MKYLLLCLVLLVAQGAMANHLPYDPVTHCRSGHANNVIECQTNEEVQNTRPSLTYGMHAPTVIRVETCPHPNCTSVSYNLEVVESCSPLTTWDKVLWVLNWRLPEHEGWEVRSGPYEQDWLYRCWRKELRP
jgi:hypothetical protein